MVKTEISQQRVTAIVPAYNEGPRIGRVLEVLTTYDGFDEVIVVDDGSSDNTAEVAQRYGVRYIRNPENCGKGRSMDIAVRAAQGDILFFADADVKQLDHVVIEETIAPVARGDVDMFIAMRNRNIYYLRPILPFVPLLGGERALTRALWRKVPSWYKEGFKIEAALNFYAKYYGKGLGFKVFRQLSQEIKERKYGVLKGMRSRFQMLYEILKAQLTLELTAVPPLARSGRIASVNALANIGGIAIGVFIVVAAMLGPVRFFKEVFAAELREDPSAPLAHFLIRVSGNLSVEAIVLAGVIIVGLNAVFLAVNWKEAVRYVHKGLLSKNFSIE